jgi:hypothetical protein
LNIIYLLMHDDTHLSFFLSFSIFPILYLYVTHIQLRCFFYTLMLAVKDESTQSTGLVVVIDACTDNGSIGPPDPQLFLKCTSLVHALPMKVQGRHFCTNDSLYGFFASYISRFHEKSIRIRSRVHVGKKEPICFFFKYTI